MKVLTGVETVRTFFFRLDMDDTQKQEPMQLHLRSGGCGTGKTYQTLLEAVSRRGRYVIAIETRARIDEVLANLRGLAASLGTTPEVISVSSIERGSTVGTSTNVVADIEALPDIWNSLATPHVICVVTHNALMRIDTEGFNLWRLIVDEVPQIFQMETTRSEASAEWFKSNFELTPTACGKWSRVKLRADALSRTKLGRDDRMKGWASFYSAVASGAVDVYSDLLAWSGMAEDRVEWSWWSFWRVEQLRGFGSVLFLGNDFKNSVFFKTVNSLSPGTIWTEVETPRRDGFQRRSATIHCFTNAHRISKSLYERRADQVGHRPGQQNLIAIGNCIRAQVGEGHIWSCNDAMFEFLGKLPGQRLTPRQAGSNAFTSVTSCTMIYSAKASKQLQSIYGDYGVTGNDIAAERELETIIQMATRIAVRDPASTEPLSYYVYDHVQAEHLAAYLRRTSYVDVEIKIIDLGFADMVVAADTPGPKRRSLTPPEAEYRRARQNEKARQRNQKSRALKAAKNPPRPRGRPSKAKSTNHGNTNTGETK
jgi:hypothetical protein